MVPDAYWQELALPMLQSTNPPPLPSISKRPSKEDCEIELAEATWAIKKQELRYFQILPLLHIAQLCFKDQITRDKFAPVLRAFVQRVGLPSSLVAKLSDTSTPGDYPGSKACQELEILNTPRYNLMFSDQGIGHTLGILGPQVN